MAGGVFVLKDDGTLVGMQEAPYDSEALLQKLLARFPGLLAGDQIDTAAPRRWLLIDREVGVPDGDDVGRRWSLDHLFLDQDAIPTLVEVKRGSDSRIRREVVGQLLDYAANGVAYWPVESLRAKFEERCRVDRKDSGATLADFLQGSVVPEAFWQLVRTNLEAGRIRLLFVADEIPAELRRVIEFLNSQMKLTEVLGVEIRQFVGQDLKTLVPRVVGQTEEASAAKGRSAVSERQWDEVSFFEDLGTRHGAPAVEVARDLLAWAKRRKLRVWFGRGSKDGSFFPMCDIAEHQHFTFSAWSYGRIEIQFQHMLRRQVFGEVGMREALRRRLCEIPGVEIPEDALSRRPTILYAPLVPTVARASFLATWDWYLAEVERGTRSGGPR